MLTTGYNFDGYKTIQYHGIINARRMCSDTHLYSDKPKSVLIWDDVFASTTDALREKATELGANAVIGIQSEIAKQGSGALGIAVIVLTGTAVTVEPV